MTSYRQRQRVLTDLNKETVDSKVTLDNLTETIITFMEICDTSPIDKTEWVCEKMREKFTEASDPILGGIGMEPFIRMCRNIIPNICAVSKGRTTINDEGVIAQLDVEIPSNSSGCCALGGIWRLLSH